jgi:hypothetical protein
MSLKVFGCLAAVWEITVPVVASTFSRPLQQGQVISKFAGRLGIARTNHTAYVELRERRRVRGDCSGRCENLILPRENPHFSQKTREMGHPGLS